MLSFAPMAKKNAEPAISMVEAAYDLGLTAAQ
jgi:hypothetical protein